MKYECSYCGATGEYIENGGVCECGAGAEWIFTVNEGLDDGDYYWGGDLMFSNVSSVLEDKRSGRYKYRD